MNELDRLIREHYPYGGAAAVLSRLSYPYETWRVQYRAARLGVRVTREARGRLNARRYPGRIERDPTPEEIEQRCAELLAAKGMV